MVLETTYPLADSAIGRTDNEETKAAFASEKNLSTCDSIRVYGGDDEELESREPTSGDTCGEFRASTELHEREEFSESKEDDRLDDSLDNKRGESSVSERTFPDPVMADAAPYDNEQAISDASGDIKFPLNSENNWQKSDASDSVASGLKCKSRPEQENLVPTVESKEASKPGTTAISTEIIETKVPVSTVVSSANTDAVASTVTSEGTGFEEKEDRQAGKGQYVSELEKQKAGAGHGEASSTEPKEELEKVSDETAEKDSNVLQNKKLVPEGKEEAISCDKRSESAVDFANYDAREGSPIAKAAKGAKKKKLGLGRFSITKSFSSNKSSRSRQSPESVCDEKSEREDGANAASDLRNDCNQNDVMSASNDSNGKSSTKIERQEDLPKLAEVLIKEQTSNKVTSAEQSEMIVVDCTNDEPDLAKNCEGKENTKNSRDCQAEELAPAQPLEAKERSEGASVKPTMDITCVPQPTLSSMEKSVPENDHEQPAETNAGHTSSRFMGFNLASLAEGFLCNTEKYLGDLTTLCAPRTEDLRPPPTNGFVSTIAADRGEKSVPDSTKPTKEEPIATKKLAHDEKVDSNSVALESASQGKSLEEAPIQESQNENDCSAVPLPTDLLGKKGSEDIASDSLHSKELGPTQVTYVIADIPSLGDDDPETNETVEKSSIDSNDDLKDDKTCTQPQDDCAMLEVRRDCPEDNKSLTSDQASAGLEKSNENESIAKDHHGRRIFKRLGFGRARGTQKSEVQEADESTKEEQQKTMVLPSDSKEEVCASTQDAIKEPTKSVPSEPYVTVLSEVGNAKEIEEKSKPVNKTAMKIKSINTALKSSKVIASWTNLSPRQHHEPGKEDQEETTNLSTCVDSEPRGEGDNGEKTIQEHHPLRDIVLEEQSAANAENSPAVTKQVRMTKSLKSVNTALKSSIAGLRSLSLSPRQTKKPESQELDPDQSCSTKDAGQHNKQALTKMKSISMVVRNTIKRTIDKETNVDSTGGSHIPEIGPENNSLNQLREEKASDDDADGIRVYGMGSFQDNTDVVMYPPHPTTRVKKKLSMKKIIGEKKKTAGKQARNMRKVVQTSLLRMKSPTMKTIMTNHVLHMEQISK